MGKVRLIKRLKWYYPTERFNAFLFLSITIYVPFRYAFINVIFLIYGLILMTYILFQGQHYWKLKLYKLTNKYFEQKKNLALFRKLKRTNIVLILCIPVVLLVQLFLSNWSIKSDNLFGWAVVANIVGILEHINYYHLQLMIDNLSDVKYLMKNKKLKIASLKKDLDENEI